MHPHNRGPPASTSHQGQGDASAADPRLDFLSPRFDALLALQTPGLQPPNPRVLPLDNMAKARVLLPDYQPRNPQRPKDQDKGREASRRAVRDHMDRREQLKQNVLQQLVERVQEGPLTLLKRCLLERRSVRVVTRHAHGVRGVAVGTLRAFDKYLNMVLRDVEERYTVLLCEPRTKTKVVLRPVAGSSAEASGQSGAGAGNANRSDAPSADEACVGEQLQQLTVECTRWRRRQDHRKRQLKQVLLRGDSVVMVSEVLEGQDNWLK